MQCLEKGVRSGKMPDMSDIVSAKAKIDNLAESFVITDPRGVVLYANKSSSAASGYAPAEIVGKKPGKLWGGHMTRDYYDRFWHTIFNERLPFVDFIHNVQKDGAPMTEYMHVAPVFDHTDEIKFYVKIQPSQADRHFSSSFQSHFSRRDWRSTTDFFSSLFGICPDAPDWLLNFFESALIEPTRDKLKARDQDALMIAAAKNNVQAFDALYQKYYGSIYKYLLQRTGYNSELSADLTQDTFLRAYRHLKTFTVSNASYGTYLLTIAHHVLAAHFRSRESVARENIAFIENLPAPASVAADLFDITLMKKTLLELSPVEQQILLLKYENNFSVREIADKLLKSENAIKLHLSRAREKMRQKMDRR